MSLYDSIALELRNGALHQPVSSSDLVSESRKVLLDGVEKYRVGFEFYAKSHVTTEFPNWAEGGYWVKQGNSARYLRVAKGEYLIIGLEENEESLSDDKEENLGIADNVCADSPPEKRVAEYLIKEEFQIYNKKRRCLYPSTPVTGLKARLDAYFWPTEKTRYAQSESVFTGFIKDAARIDLARPGPELVQLFEKICSWGGVKLPTSDAAVIARNVFNASDGLEASVNSAWTKLYAVFLPDRFIIFDSRVATAIIHIAERVLTAEELVDFKIAYPHLGVIVGRGGTRPRATLTSWKNAYRKWPAQIDANALALKIMGYLEAEQAGLSLRELEAILFMEGY